MRGMLDCTASIIVFVMARRPDACPLCLSWTVCGRSRGMIELGNVGSQEFCEPGGKRFKTILETASGACRELRAFLRFTGIGMQLEFSPSCFNVGGITCPGTSPTNCNIFARNKELYSLTFISREYFDQAFLGH